MYTVSLRLKIMSGIILVVVACGLLFGHTWVLHFLSVSSIKQVHAKTAHARANVSIPKNQDLFEPFILVVPLDAIVTWHNEDSVAHVVTTTPQQNQFLNRQTFSWRIPAGRQAQFTFKEAGLYHYYDSTMSSWNTPLSRVAAHSGTPHFPLAMDGIIWVQGAISSLPTAAVNSVIAGHDEFASEFLAIEQPGGVSWHNFDTDPHFVGPVAGWSGQVNPTDIGLYRIAGTDDTPGGATVTIIFNTPGLYYYYCRNHDLIDTPTDRAKALPMASEYPIPMEGFVLVLNQ